MKELCKNCKHWKFVFSIGRGDKYKRGVCRRYPPKIFSCMFKENERYSIQVVSGMTDYGTKSTDGILPLVSAKDYCGEFNAAPRRIDAAQNTKPTTRE